MAPSVPLAEPARWRSLPVILTGTFMVLFDLWVVTVAAPSIQVDLGTGEGGLALVVAGYSFVYALGVVTGGRMGDRYGRRRMYVCGLGVFSAASLLCGIAPSTAWLVGGRLVQGVGAALLVPQVLALISTLFPPGERNRAFTFFGVANGLAGVSGQALGGLLVYSNLGGLGWRVIFLVNVPIGLTAIAAVFRLVPERRSSDPEPIDGLGVLLATVGLGALLAPLVLGPDGHWPPWTFASLACSVPILALFAWYQLREETAGRSSMLRLRVLRRRSVLSGLAVTAGCFSCFAGLQFGMSLFLQRGLGQDSLRFGLTWAPASIAFVPAALLARHSIARFGRVVLTVGSVIAVIGITTLIVLVHTEQRELESTQIAIAVAILGMGMGCVTPSLVGVVLIGLPTRLGGAASGVLLTAQQLSSAAGVAIVGSVYYAVGAAHGPVGGIESALFVALTLCAGASAATLLLPNRPGVHDP